MSASTCASLRLPDRGRLVDVLRARRRSAAASAAAAVSSTSASASSAWFELELRRGDLPRLGVPGLLQGGLGRRQLRLGLRQLGLEGLLVDDEQELAGLDVAPLVEMDLLEEPATRARMETSWRARVVPIGSAMMGTVIRRASTTATTGGGGARSASACGEQPEIATEAQATPRASHPAGLGPSCLRAVMILPPVRSDHRIDLNLGNRIGVGIEVWAHPSRRHAVDPERARVESTGQGVAPQIVAAYSAIVRSLENFPERATLRIALRRPRLRGPRRGRTRAPASAAYDARSARCM